MQTSRIDLMSDTATRCSRAAKKMSGGDSQSYGMQSPILDLVAVALCSAEKVETAYRTRCAVRLARRLLKNSHLSTDRCYSRTCPPFTFKRFYVQEVLVSVVLGN